MVNVSFLRIKLAFVLLNIKTSDPNKGGPDVHGMW